MSAQSYSEYMMPFLPDEIKEQLAEARFNLGCVGLEGFSPIEELRCAMTNLLDAIETIMEVKDEVAPKSYHIPLPKAGEELTVSWENEQVNGNLLVTVKSPPLNYQGHGELITDPVVSS